MYLVLLKTNRLWLVDPSDVGGASVVCGSITSGTSPTIQGGAFRQLAGNRTKVSIRNSTAASYNVVLRALTPDQHQQVLDWTGRTLLLRTFEGVRMFGTYLAVSQKRILNTTGDRSRGANFLFDDEISFGQTSYDESV